VQVTSTFYLLLSVSTLNEEKTSMAIAPSHSPDSSLHSFPNKKLPLIPTLREKLIICSTPIVKIEVKFEFPTKIQIPPCPKFTNFVPKHTVIQIPPCPKLMQD